MEFVNKKSGYKSRFTVPLSYRISYRLESKIRGRLGYNTSIPNTVANTDYPIPPYWQEVLGYLHQAGVIHAPQFIMDPAFPQEPEFFSVYLPTSPIAPHTDGEEPNPFNRGSSLNIQEAFSKAVGELLERYPLAIYRNKDFLRASTRNLQSRGYRFVDPEAVSHFSEAQRKNNNRAFDQDTIFQWAWGRSLFDRHPVLIPAQLIFWNYCHDFLEGGEPYLREINTNGAAGMFTLTEAILSGLYELIQRDAFLIFWLNRIAPPRIDVSRLHDGPIAELLKRCKNSGLEAVVLNITSDLGVPSVAAALIAQSGYPKINIGAGCDGDPLRALAQALEEALSIRHWTMHARKYYGGPLPDVSQVINSPGFIDGQRMRIFFWADPANFRHLEFFLQGKSEPLESFLSRVSSKSSPAQKLSHLMRILRNKGPGYEPYYYEANHPILKDLGYYSVRVIVPPLIHMYMRERNIPLGAKRLREVPALLGCRPTAELNTWPHPFP